MGLSIETYDVFVFVCVCVCVCDLCAPIFVEKRAQFRKFKVVEVMVTNKVKRWELIFLQNIPNAGERFIGLRLLHLQT